jgi:murein L,D-transpeptidase YcbB/YkuD
LRGEIVPKISTDPEYLQKNNFEVATHSGEVVTHGGVNEEELAQLRAGKLMVRQKPGPKNALGLIKFVFPNADNIYLHSTPSQALFGESRRDFSHEDIYGYDNTDHVCAAMVNGKLRIDANEDRETVVHIVVPVETIRDAVNRLEEVSPGI